MFDDQDDDTDSVVSQDDDTGGGGGASPEQPSAGAIPTDDQGADPDQGQALVAGDTGDLAPSPNATPAQPQQGAIDTVKRALGYARRQFGILPQSGGRDGAQATSQEGVQTGARTEGAIPDDSPGARQQPADAAQPGTQQGAIPTGQPGPGGDNDPNAKPGDDDFVNRNVKDKNAKYVPYLMGAGAAPPQVVDAIEANIDRHNQMDPNDRKMMALQYARQKGGEKAAAGLLQSYRQQFDAGKSFAAAALTGIPGKKAPDVQAATDAATKAFQSLPDGTKTVFSPSGNGVTAAVTNLDGSSATYNLGTDQFNALLRGRGGQFDELLAKGVGPTMDQSGGGSAGSAPQGGKPAPGGTSGDNDVDVRGTDGAAGPEAGGVPEANNQQPPVGQKQTPQAEGGAAQPVPKEAPPKKPEDDDDQPIHEMFRVTPGMRKAGISQALMNMSLQRFPWMSQNEQRADWLMNQANAGQANDLKKQELENKREGAERKGTTLEKVQQLKNEGGKEQEEIKRTGKNESTGIQAGARTESATIRATGLEEQQRLRNQGGRDAQDLKNKGLQAVQQQKDKAAMERQLAQLQAKAQSDQERNRIGLARETLKGAALGMDIGATMKELRKQFPELDGGPQAPQAPQAGGLRTPVAPKPKSGVKTYKDPNTGETFEVQ